MNVKDIKTLSKYEKESANKIIESFKKKFEDYISTFSIPDETTEDLDKEELRILTFLYSVYHNDCLSNTKVFHTDEEIFNSVKVDPPAYSATVSKFQTNRVCEKLTKIGLLETHKNKMDDAYYISKYGVLYILSTQKEYEWSDGLFKNTILGSIHVVMKNIIDQIVFNEIEKNNHDET
jgi:hypothetical protein